MISYWVAKAMLESSLSYLPLLCYILYQNQLMDELETFMVFLLFVYYRTFVHIEIGYEEFTAIKCCFEKPIVGNCIDIILNNMFKLVKGWNLVRRL